MAKLEAAAELEAAQENEDNVENKASEAFTPVITWSDERKNEGEKKDKRNVRFKILALSLRTAAAIAITISTMKSL